MEEPGTPPEEPGTPPEKPVDNTGEDLGEIVHTEHIHDVLDSDETIEYNRRSAEKVAEMEANTEATIEANREAIRLNQEKLDAEFAAMQAKSPQVEAEPAENITVHNDGSLDGTFEVAAQENPPTTLDGEVPEED